MVLPGRHDGGTGRRGTAARQPLAVPEPAAVPGSSAAQGSASGAAAIDPRYVAGAPEAAANCPEARFPRLKTAWQNFWGCDGGPTALPLGAVVQAPVSIQIANGEGLRMVLYAYDFENDPCRDMSQLNPHGLRRLGELLCMAQHNAFPIVIEASRDNPALDSRRQQRVLAAAQQTVAGLPSARSWWACRRPPR